MDTPFLRKNLPESPYALFKQWFDEACQKDSEYGNAMVLATVNQHGEPSQRVVLLKSYDDQGFVFFTNYNSQKAADLGNNQHAALLFFWPPLRRQIRITGTASKTAAKQSSEYFLSRPAKSRISAWASPQSQVVADRAELEALYKKYEEKFQNEEMTCPPFWGGYRVQADSIEFWQNRDSRLHDRFRYQKQKNGGWLIERLGP